MTSVARPLLLLLCALLAACAARPRAVVVERSTDPSVSRSVSRDAGGTRRDYLVARGDTLYGIAFRHDVDFRDLARWNGITAPYTIYPGQRLSLRGPRLASAPSRTAPARTSAPSPPPGTRAPVTTMPPPAAPAPVRAAPPSVANPARPSPPTAATPATPPPPGGVRNAQGVTWRWPASGQVISRHVAGDPTRQGINIAGSSGQPVFAAAQGEVVYSGAGLIGYGELVIIKHSDEFLSAYGHNRKRLVAEGQRVAAGQQIAEMGRSGAARDMLHFEIRRNGKPVDPLPMLPGR